MSATISWSPTSAVLSVVLVDPNGVVVPTTTTGSNPTTVTGQASVTGTYKVRVKAKSGSANFSGTVTYPGISVPTYAGQIGGGSAGHAPMYPSGLDVGPDGTVYVADTGNDQVAAYAADGTQVWRIGARGAKAAGNFNNPRDIAYLNGEIFVDDTGNNRVQVLDASTHAVVGTPWPLGTSSLGITAGKDVTGQNIILVSEDVTNRIAVFQPDGQPVCTIPVPKGGSKGLAALPRDAATNATGTVVYVAAYQDDQIDTFGGVNVSTSTCPTTMTGHWGTSGTQPGQFKRPYGVAVDPSGNVYVADSDNERIQEFNGAGSSLLHIYGDKTPANGGSGDLFQLRRVAVANGQVYAADLWGWHIDRFTACATSSCPTPAQTYPTPVAGPATGSFNEPSGLAFDGSGNLYVADSVNQRIQPFTPGANGATWATGIPWGNRGWGASDQSGFNWPRDISVAADGTLWAADTKNNRLLQFIPGTPPTDGRMINIPKPAPTSLPWPYGVDAVGSHLIVANTFTSQIESFNTDGSQAWAAPVNTAGGIALKNPYDVTDDGNGHLVVADTGNKRVIELDAATGSYLKTIIATGLHSPQGVAIDPNNGNLWIADTSYNQLVEFNSQGAPIQTVKNLVSGGTFNHPTHVEVHQDATGHSYLYVCDEFNDRIVILDLNEN
jgi:DNA-binding beta-propeller fold protein YncE